MLQRPGNDEVRVLLAAWRAGDLPARDRLFEILYGELKLAAAAMLRGERNVSLSISDLSPPLPRGHGGSALVITRACCGRGARPRSPETAHQGPR